MGDYKGDLISHLSGFITGERFEVLNRVLDQRTRYITVLLEDIYQSQNASAVLRTCDCLGIQDLHIVEKRNRYEVNPDVALGSSQWLSLHYYRDPSENTVTAIESLKAKGYRIVATSPHSDGETPDTFDLNKGKAVVMFGTELNGLTASALELADEHIRIPMVGFTESFNISVSAAIVLYQLRRKLEGSSADWKLVEAEKRELLLEWLRSSIKMSDQIEAKFRKEYPSTF